MSHLSRLWRGDLTLENAFWNWAIFGGLAVNVASSALFLYLVNTDRLLPAFIVGYGVSLPYNFVVTVGVWRSADRHAGERRQAEFARIVTIVIMVILSLT